LRALQTYLERVAEYTEDFTEIADIVKRYETLVATNSDLQVKVQRNNLETERLRLELAQLTKKLQNEVLVQSSVIAEHQERLEKAKIESNAEELVKEQMEDAAKSRIREIGEARMAVLNLYNRCRLTHLSESRPKQEAKDVMLALRYIGERMRDLQSIVGDGAAAGLIGPVKVREAVVDRTFVPHQRGGGQTADKGGAGGGGGGKPPRAAKAGVKKTAGESGDLAGLLNPGTQAPLE
jgi:hypothetical protein